MNASDARQRARRPLVDGRQMLCPRCKNYRDILDFDRMEQPVEYEKETNALYKCPKKRGGCSWIFSPADVAVVESLRREVTNL